MTLFNPVFNCVTPKGIKRSKTQADEGLTPADEAGYVVLRQPPASELANLFRKEIRKEIRCRFIILSRKDEPTPDFP